MNNNYLERNMGWMAPLVIGLMLAAMPIMFEALQMKNPLPSWVSLFVAVIGVCVAGFKAAFTDTLSANIFKYVAQVVVLGFCVVYLYRLFSSY
ncbi:TPA: hypothetical protein HL452_22565 [Escherichia coli]|uniref:hypothetical protein n=1 Tax=Escherichia coli TaxID=562 RepID=UPI00101E1E2A|nr:hypothetical protein [Escherichia coli]EAW6352578.1 hypothetical protein [Salmonella enterica]RYH91538.1 hypothetical protein EVY45_23425 [Escherichia coli]HAJ0472115.1 hypothetical protein [Escherichia coli]HAZ6985747.1 hypothetical protein [Escherichia coli]